MIAGTGRDVVGSPVIVDQHHRSVRQPFRVVGTQPTCIRQIMPAVPGNCLAQDEGSSLPQRFLEETEKLSRGISASKPRIVGGWDCR